MKLEANVGKEELMKKEEIYRMGTFLQTRRREGNGGKYFEKENIFLAEKKMNREGRGGKYLEKENIFQRSEEKIAEEEDI